MSLKFPSLPNVRLLVKRVFPTPRPVVSSDPLARLQAAADGGDEAAFLSAQRTIDWTNRPPEDFARAIRLALQAGAHLAARQLAADGAARFPAHAELQKYARVLAPPKVSRSNLSPDPTLRANRDWLMSHGDEYRGQWVALRKGELLAARRSLDELVKAVDNTNGVLLTPVY